MRHLLDRFVGQDAVFIETGDACLGTVDSVFSDGERVRAVFNFVPGSFRCRLRLIRDPGDEAIKELLDEPPFGDTWDVNVSNKEFFLADHVWQASFHFGGGFGAFFQPDVVRRFAGGDVTWLDEYYGEDEDDEDVDTDG